METIDPIHNQVRALLDERAMTYTLQAGVFVVDQTRECIRFTTRITPDFFNCRIQTLIVNTSAPLEPFQIGLPGKQANVQTVQPREREQIYALVSLLNPVTELMGSLSFDSARATINHTWRVPVPATLDQRTFTAVVNAGLNSIDGCRPAIIAVASGAKTATAAFLTIISPRAQTEDETHALNA